ncbi:hypothetical protein [Kitasatospora sp. NBC_01302]|uniref:hypothetical protein n=1 Tax=Kitasatospora sp. NBC_01302 TaxID=2903575 RepID=UPI002E109391|nr:hypothetical protein OG294_24815 [Kitasatospora sp. NBC_01302]
MVKSHSYRLHLPLEFETPAAALAWFDEAQRTGLLPADVDLFHPDALDAAQHGFSTRDLIVRRTRDRIASLAVRAGQGANHGR